MDLKSPVVQSRQPVKTVDRQLLFSSVGNFSACRLPVSTELQTLMSDVTQMKRPC